MAAAHPNSFKARKTLKVGSRSYTYFSLKAVEKEVGDLSRLPFSLRVLLENLENTKPGHETSLSETFHQLMKVEMKSTTAPTSRRRVRATTAATWRSCAGSG